MRHLPVLALAAFALLLPRVHARELQELRERVRDGVQRTDKDLATYIHPDKLNKQQREKFDSAVKDLGELREAVTDKRWEGDRKVLERAVDNIDSVVKQAPISEDDRQTLGIDIFTLRVILDSWKP